VVNAPILKLYKDTAAMGFWNGLGNQLWLGFLVGEKTAPVEESAAVEAAAGEKAAPVEESAAVEAAVKEMDARKKKMSPIMNLMRLRLIKDVLQR